MHIEKKMIAFVHIEKAAGQTFIRILENNFVYKHCRVATLKKRDEKLFRWDDLKILLKFNPYLEALAGHSVKPYSDLVEHVPNIRYITILRDPIKRYISHYQYWVQALKKQIDFKTFLSLEHIKNFQVNKIAGVPDLKSAISILQKNLFLVGVLDEFDEFLFVLQRKLSPQYFDIAYERKNVAKSNWVKKKIYEEFDQYREQIERNNQLDMELYDFAKNTLFPREKKTWIKDKEPLIKVSSRHRLGLTCKREIIGRLYRNLYMGPIISIIRYRNGLKVGGSY